MKVRFWQHTGIRGLSAIQRERQISPLFASFPISSRSTYLKRGAMVDNTTCDVNTCGDAWVLQTFERANCQGASSFSLIPNQTSSCVSSFGNSSRQQICDRSKGVFGLWIYAGSPTCDSESAQFFAGVGIGVCINTNFSSPLSSPSVAVWCNVKDAKTPTPSYPTFSATPLAPTNATSGFCDANETNCDMYASQSNWPNQQCQGNVTNTTSIIPLPLGTCFNFSSQRIAPINIRATCAEKYIKVGVYGRGCSSSALSQVFLLNTENCLPTSTGGSLRYSCKRTSNASTLKPLLDSTRWGVTLLAVLFVITLLVSL